MWQSTTVAGSPRSIRSFAATRAAASALGEKSCATSHLCGAVVVVVVVVVVIITSAELELFHAVAERVTADAEQARGRGLVAVAARERLREQTLLDGLEVDAFGRELEGASLHRR